MAIQYFQAKESDLWTPVPWNRSSTLPLQGRVNRQYR